MSIYIYVFAYYLLIFIELYFSNFRPLSCFSVMIPELCNAILTSR